MIGKTKIILLSFIFLSFFLKGQDIHFSQFYNAAMNLNPGLTGNFDGDYRVAANYRNQWNSVTIPFTTSSFAGDVNSIFGKKGVGAGIVFNYDNTGDSRFRTTIFNISGSYRLKLNSDSSQTITTGIQTGITNKRLSYDELKFDAQYNGTRYSGSLPNREDFAVNSQSFFNLHMGFVYSNTIDARTKFNAGIAFFNLTKPKESYFNNQAVRLDRRLSAFLNYQFPLNTKMDLIPSMFFMQQGKYFEYIVGSRGKYTLSEGAGNYQAAYLGVFFRTKDAGFITVEYDYNNWQLGLSYDINLSSLSKVSNGRGGIELSAVYIWKLFKPSSNKHKFCPDYI